MIQPFGTSIFEDAPGWWELPALVILIRIKPPQVDDSPREVIGVEVWLEDDPP